MPQLTRRRVLLKHIWELIELLIEVLKVMPEDDMILMLLDEVLGIYKKILARRYFAARGSAGRHHVRGISILENLIRNYPESAFLNLFRMHRTSFWMLVDLITPHPTNHSLNIFFDPVSNASGFLPFGCHCAILGGIVMSRAGGVVMSRMSGVVMLRVASGVVMLTRVL
ncbi:hypothetical protein EV426DRAFT_610450, partial [Tirmania nivea]